MLTESNLPPSVQLRNTNLWGGYNLKVALLELYLFEDFPQFNGKKLLAWNTAGEFPFIALHEAHSDP